MPINLNDQINYLRQIPGFGQYLGDTLQRLQDGVNLLGQNTATDPVGTLPAPPPIQQLVVKTNGTGLVHAVITDSSHIQKGINYFVEFDTSPSFPQPHVVHLGASRSMLPTMLPGKDDNGNVLTYYFRAYSQYPGGAPGVKVSPGGSIQPGGTQNMTLLSSTGSGTAPGTGQGAGQGFGKNLFRPAVNSAKRI